MKIKCLDVVHGITKKGNPTTKGAFKGINKAGSPYLFVASCPSDFKGNTEYNVNVAFTSNGNYVLPY